MNDKPKFEVRYLQEALDFINSLPDKAKVKLLSNIEISRYVLDKEKFKKLTDSDIWEFRAKSEGRIYRVLAFWDKNENALVIATHGFEKKTQKTPENEKAKAKQIMKKYLTKS